MFSFCCCRSSATAIEARGSRSGGIAPRSSLRELRSSLVDTFRRYHSMVRGLRNSCEPILDNITLTRVTNTGISSGRLHWENTLGFFDVKGAMVPAAVSVFAREMYQAPRSWTEQAYPNLIYFNEVDAGNHFAAWQEPEIFTNELRAAFRSLRDEGRSS